MRTPGAILLVSCYELGHQPLAVAWAAAFLEARGFVPAIMDVSVEPFDPDKVARARLVAVSVPMHTALRVGAALIARVRAVSPTCHVVAYGLYAELNAEHLFTLGVDSVIGGEIEPPLVALAEALASGSGELVPGVRTAGRRVAPHLARLPFPVPSRAALSSLKQYARLERDGRHEVAGYVEASRGCKHLCRHCPIPPVYQGRFFAVPADVVLADARAQIAAGARHIDFGDPDFLNGPTHALRVARALPAEHPDVTFSFTAKIQHIVAHAGLIPELAAAGALFVVSAVESLSDRVLAALAKGHRAADVPRALAIVRGAGMSMRPTFVAFTPWTTVDDYLELCRFIRDNDLEAEVDPVQLSRRLLVPPGSLLLSASDIAPDISPFLGALDEEAASYRWTHPDPRMDGLEAEVSGLVEAATAAGEAPATTFGRIHRLAAAAAGVAADTETRAAGEDRAGRAAPPHLTEPWFCCAQPTRRQLGAV